MVDWLLFWFIDLLPLAASYLGHLEEAFTAKDKALYGERLSLNEARIYIYTYKLDHVTKIRRNVSTALSPSSSEDLLHFRTTKLQKKVFRYSICRLLMWPNHSGLQLQTSQGIAKVWAPESLGFLMSSLLSHSNHPITTPFSASGGGTL